MEYGDQNVSLATTTTTASSSNKRKAGRKKFQETRHPVYRGVRERNGKWVCELREPNKKSRVWVGTFSSPHLAARAYDVAALAIKGESASLNFPNDVKALPQARSSSIKDIQEAAMEAAETIVDADFSGAENVEEGSSGRELYFDEEEVFNMPRILDDMAEGLILTPLGMRNGFCWDDLGDDDSMDLSLWK